MSQHPLHGILSTHCEDPQEAAWLHHSSFLYGKQLSFYVRQGGSFSPSQMTREEGSSWALYTLAVVGFQAHFIPNLLSLFVSPGSFNQPLSSAREHRDFPEFHTRTTMPSSPVPVTSTHLLQVSSLKDGRELPQVPLHRKTRGATPEPCTPSCSILSCCKVVVWEQPIVMRHRLGRT